MKTQKCQRCGTAFKAGRKPLSGALTCPACAKRADEEGPAWRLAPRLIAGGAALVACAALLVAVAQVPRNAPPDEGSEEPAPVVVAPTPQPQLAGPVRVVTTTTPPKPAVFELMTVDPR